MNLKPQLKVKLSPIFIRVIIIIVVIFGLSYWSINLLLNKLAQNSQTVVAGMIGHPNHINPLWAINNSVDQSLTKLIYRGLSRINENNQPEPDLADHWEISEDQKVYTVYLKTNSFWQDGHPITADDVAFTYGILQDPNYNGPEKNRFFGVGIEIISGEVIKFTLTQPFTPFTESISLGVLPKHIWDNLPPQQMETSPYNINVVGSGNFLISNLIVNNQLVTQLTLRDKITNTAQIIKFYSNYQELTEAFKLGLIDTFSTTEPQARTDFASWSNLTMLPTQICGQAVTIFFNSANNNSTGKNSTLFRQAVATLITNQPGFDQTSLRSAMSSTHWAYTEHPITLLDLTKAKTEISAANDPEQPYTIITDTSAVGEKYGKMLERIFQENGLATQLSQVPLEHIPSDVLHGRNFDAFVATQQFTNDPDQYSFWHSSQLDLDQGGMNITGYTNRILDKSLEDGRQSTNVDVRKAAYSTMLKRLNDDLPAIFLTYPEINTVSRINTSNHVPEQCLWHETDYLSKSLGRIH